MTSFIKMLLLLPVLSLLLACGSGNSSQINNPTISLVTPISSVVAAGSTLQLRAIVSGSSNTTVLWFVNNIPGGNSTVGTITPQGLYTAPNLPTNNGSVIISASPQAYPVVSTSVVIGITFASMSLSGNYVFTLNGLQAGSPMVTAGSFTANGDGTISNGIEDINAASGIATGLPFTGSYIVNANGQGIATFTSSQGSVSLGFTLNNQGQAVIMSTDPNTVASGTFFPQLSTALSLTSLNAPFVFNLSGSNPSGTLVSSVGTFVTDGSSNFSYAEEDVNAGVTTVHHAFTGSYSLGTNGPGTGTASFTDAAGTAVYDFYIVSPTQFQFIEVDSSGLLSGTVFEQQSVDSTTALYGSYVYYVSGAVGNADYGVAGGFSTDPLNSGNIIAGTNDINELGALASNSSLTGSFTTSSHGRGTISLSGINGVTNYVYYFISPSTAFVLTTDPAVNASGQLFSQFGGFGTASLTGFYTYTLTTPATVTPPTTAVGLLNFNGAGAIAGYANINNDGTLSGQQAVTGTISITPATATTSARGLVSLNVAGSSSDFVLYPISISSSIMMSNGLPAIAIMVSQF